MKNPIKIETLYWFDIFPNKNNPLNKEENYVSISKQSESILSLLSTNLFNYIFTKIVVFFSVLSFYLLNIGWYIYFSILCFISSALNI